MKLLGDTILTFGKYKGKSLLEISDIDPSYIVWLHEETLHEPPYELVVACEKDVEDEDDCWGDR